MIYRANIFLEPLANKMDIPRLLYSMAIGTHLPMHVSPAGLTHAGLYIPINSWEGILLEYGAYDDRRSGDYKNQIHYLEGRDGLRFLRISLKDLQQKKSSVFYKIMECKVKHPMTIGNLLNSIRYQRWNQDSYNPVGKNCQRFVRETIKVLGLYRPGLRNHTYDKMDIPFGILNALEKNENDIGNVIWRGFNKIPIIGPIGGGFGSLFTEND